MAHKGGQKEVNMNPGFADAIKQICEEKNISQEIVMETIEAALGAAYKKDFGTKDQEVRVDLNAETGEVVVFIQKEVVDEVENEATQIDTVKANMFKKGAKVGDIIEIKDLPSDFGRIAAQTAKQVIIQRIREAERDMVFGEYKDKEGEVVNGSVQRVEGNNVIVDMGKAVGILFPNEQIQGERYYAGQRLKFFVVRVEQTNKGPQIVISRSHPGLVKRLFELEVPEILAGIVEIKAIAREAGQRTKMAVSSNQDGVDPVGSCVGQRGVRVQAVMGEIGEEKIDIILFDEDQQVFISNALSPAKVNKIILNEEEKKAEVHVPEDQLSLAIGKSGQNVRLAAKLTGWNVDIKGSDESGVEAAANILRPVEDKRDLEEEILKAVGGNTDTEVATDTSEIPAETTELPEIAETTEPAAGSEMITEDSIDEAAPVTEVSATSEMPAIVEEVTETAPTEVPAVVEAPVADDGVDDMAELLEAEKTAKTE
jgi:transcription termination/antitermination protein NusA